MQHSETNKTKANDPEITIKEFSDLDIRSDLLQGIFNYGFVKPSSIQLKTIPPLLKRKDTIIEHESGTGKTTAYLIPALQLLDSNSKKCHVLILVPTRELALNVQVVMRTLGTNLKVSIQVCVGGTSIKEDQKKFEEGAQVVIGTPGRVYDFIKRGFLNIKQLKLLVLDEADEILSRGFQDHILEILKLIEDDVQIGIASATLPQAILELAKNYTRDPVIIRDNRQDLTLEGVKQYYIVIDKEEWKLDTLIELCLNLDIQQVVIYCNTRRQVDKVTTRLREGGYRGSGVHDDMSSQERELIFRQYRTGEIRLLAATDLLGRSHEISMGSLIVNYDVPSSKENYLYRNGRGRFVRRGAVINFVTPNDHRSLQEIERHFNTEINELPLDISDIL